ncbi:MAG TPA: hypothetical protein DCS93_25000 [Microscillaceae bacterium]|nr:hypothetical protein [Microscillaceae bacterium]
MIFFTPRFLWILFVGVLFYTQSFGQTKQRFSGPMYLGKLKVNAQYEYDLLKEDTLLDGRLSLKRFTIDSLSLGLNYYLSVDGVCTEGIPDKNWQLKFGEFRVDRNPQLTNYHLQHKVSGLYHTATVRWQAGKAHGSWIHEVKKLNESIPQKTLFESKVNFKEGIPVGIISIKSHQHTLLGRFLKNGLAHDVWELNFGETPGNIEQWHFSNGRLEKVSIGDNQQVNTLKVYTNEIQRAKNIHLDHRYLQILGLQNLYDSSAYAKAGGQIPSVIQMHSSYNQRVAGVFTNLKQLVKKVSMPSLQVKVAHYPLSQKEKKQVATLKSNYQKITSTSQALLKNTNLNILKYANEEVLFLLSTMQAITQKHLVAIKKVVQYDNKDLLDFWPRSNMQQQLGLDKKFSPEIKVTYQDSTGSKTRVFTGPRPELLQSDQQGVAYLASYSSYLLLCINTIAENLNKELRNKKIQQELSELETVLLSQINELDKLIDSIDQQLPTKYQPTTQKIRKTANTELRLYSGNKDLASKPTQARALINCLKNLKSLAISLSQLPDRWTKIQKLYTEQVWNPFTSTIMNDQIKKRLTQAYQELLIPSILKSIETDLKCANTQTHQKALDTLYKKMQELRKQNTTRLERKLRRENNPEVVLELFGISM